MLSLISPSKAQLKIAHHMQGKRLSMGLTQEGLADRSGVPLATLRKFEQKGVISLESLLKLLIIVGGLEELINILKPAEPSFTSIDEVLRDTNPTTRKRGNIK
ncbi:XRE family transcriptional regulator [Sphingobacterium sp. ML3W]|uniref:helix-turn-helix domain-containing protein n=1 Tax=Sphingobacterium sp. ML3W TaxID=1538644 RepID=UPI0004F83BCD|nr:helix-turn-helix transcriptional regulator [Sphingobacterium sp. ML3W]AIM38994.1 XRE family transcriptional regulator [Sphingobacterium sp. ML3W]